MNEKSVLKSLNMTEGEVLVLEKAKDRLEFEALPIMNAAEDKCLFGDTDCNDYCKVDTPPPPKKD